MVLGILFTLTIQLVIFMYFAAIKAYNIYVIRRRHGKLLPPKCYFLWTCAKSTGKETLLLLVHVTIAISLVYLLQTVLELSFAAFWFITVCLSQVIILFDILLQKKIKDSCKPKGFKNTLEQENPTFYNKIME